MKFYLSLVQRFSVIFVLILATNLLGQLSPGDLSKFHADLEGLKNCTKCHEIGEKVQPNRCLSCHLILKTNIDQKKGLHARPGYSECVDCHYEHQGRNFKLIEWPGGQDNFDHQETGYLLEGGHKTVDCRKCHTARNIQNPGKLTAQKKDMNRTFLGLSRECLSCHLDEHRGQFDKNCTACHEMKGWKPAEKFDHNKTPFPLTGLHNSVKCENCHKTNSSRPLNGDADYIEFRIEKFNLCTDCHKDVHNGKFGKDCVKCHSTSGWKNYNRSNFDHNKTNYPLQGKHREVNCEKCHTPAKSRLRLAYGNCTDCHADFHRGQFKHLPEKGECKTCHTVAGFEPSLYTIEQHNRSDFELTGAHLAIPCIACHQVSDKNSKPETNKFTFTGTKCADCHRDVHEGQISKFMLSDGCRYCHSVDSWRNIKFDHDQTNFKLSGRHKTTACTSCHNSGSQNGIALRINFGEIDSKCISCHADIHLGQFVTSTGEVTCERCHSFNNWSAANFDHNRDSAFKLEGAHLKTACSGCHLPGEKDGKKYIVYKPIDTRCSNCHKETKS